MWFCFDKISTLRPNRRKFPRYPFGPWASLFMKQKNGKGTGFSRFVKGQTKSSMPRRVHRGTSQNGSAKNARIVEGVSCKPRHHYPSPQ